MLEMHFFAVFKVTSGVGFRRSNAMEGWRVFAKIRVVCPFRTSLEGRRGCRETTCEGVGQAGRDATGRAGGTGTLFGSVGVATSPTCGRLISIKDFFVFVWASATSPRNLGIQNISPN